MAYYVIRSEQGPEWNPDRPLREQRLWTEHAAYINSLLAADRMLLGGPIGDGTPYRAMVVWVAASEADVRARLADDPWYRAGVLRVVSIERWDLIATNDRLDPALAEIARKER
ncbi:MAG TPA: YciI family protein [Thermoplasmata archaeon]|nr:YciI family protein [Thermoplasmata archaeon]